MEQQMKQVIGDSAFPDSWKRHAAYALNTLPDQEIPFLTEAHLEKVRQRIPFSDSRAELISNTIGVIRENPDLRYLAWLWHCILFRKQDFEYGEAATWPLPLQPPHTKVSLPELFPVVILLSGYDHILSVYEKIGNIPEDIQTDTLAKVNDAMTVYQEENDGKEGMSLTSFNFMMLHFHAKLFSIGRLEFEIKPFGNYGNIYQKSNGEVLALAQPGVRYRRDGEADGTNDIYDEQSWAATIKETEHDITGYPISEEGRAIQQTVTLHKAEWTLVLSEGDEILNVHIPRKGDLTVEACQDAYNRAETFFRTCFPERNFKAFVCVSWLMNPELRHMLKETSNLIAFQRPYTLFPLQANDRGVYKFVFRSDPCPVEELPETTSLQRRLKQYMLSGGHLHRVGGVIVLP